MSNREDIINIFSELNEAKFKRAKTLLKDKDIPAGKVDSVKDVDDMAELLLGHFQSAELKKLILDILKKTKSENVIEKFKDTLSDPSPTNGGATSSTTEISATTGSSNTRAQESTASIYRYPEQPLSAQRPASKLETLYMRLSENLDSKDICKIKSSLTQRYISKQKATEIQSTFDIFRILQEEGYISRDNQDLLIKLLNEMGRADLIYLVHDCQSHN